MENTNTRSDRAVRITPDQAPLGEMAEGHAEIAARDEAENGEQINASRTETAPQVRKETRLEQELHRHTQMGVNSSAFRSRYDDLIHRTANPQNRSVFRRIGARH